MEKAIELGLELLKGLIAANFCLLVINVIWKYHSGVPKASLKYIAGMFIGFSLAIVSCWQLQPVNTETLYIWLLSVGVVLELYCYFKWTSSTRVLTKSDLYP